MGGSAFRNLIYFHEADRGGHFAMWGHRTCLLVNCVPHSDHSVPRSKDQHLVVYLVDRGGVTSP